MGIHQLSVSYVAEQDRFLLRINNQGSEELRMWLTRRLTLGLLPVLRKTSADQIARQWAPASPGDTVEAQRQTMLANFKKEEAAYGGDFDTPYQPPEKDALHGQGPLLVTEIKVTLLESGQIELGMLEKLGGQVRNVQITMEAQLAQGLLHLLTRGLQQSGWLETGAIPALPDAAAPGLARADESVYAEDADDSEESTARASAGKPKYLN